MENDIQDNLRTDNILTIMKYFNECKGNKKEGNIDFKNVLLIIHSNQYDPKKLDPRSEPTSDSFTRIYLPLDEKCDEKNYYLPLNI